MRSLLVLLVLVSGCDFYFSDGDDEPPCQYDVATGKEALAPEQLYRNPYSGECQGFGGYPCDDRCGPCPATDQAIPDWGSCYSQCEGLGEAACMGTAGCFAAYTTFPNQDRADEYRACYQTAPSGPIDGACTGLDAQQCSRHDNCTAHYIQNWGARQDQAPQFEFEFCKDEKTTPTPACETLTTEVACTSRADCTPVYKGEDCTCTPSGCDCKIKTYARCET